MEVIHDMFVEPTAHHLCDSGSIYGRSYEANAKRDLEAEPLARFKDGYVTVSTYHHLNAMLERNALCIAFDMLDDGSNWNSDYYGVTQLQQEFLENIGARVGDGWNTYNWENRFDQVLQGHDVDIDQEKYVLLQVHGGCDVRSGYTKARLFKIDDWDYDYWLADDCDFPVRRADLEKAGLPVIPGRDPDELLCLEFRAGSYQPVAYDYPDESPGICEEFDIDLYKLPRDLELEGSALAVEH